MNRKKILTILPYLSAATRVGISISGFNIRLEQLFISVAFLLLIITVLAGQKFYFDEAGFFLILIWGLNFYSSAFHSPDKKYSLIQSFNVMSISTGYFIFSNYLKSKEDFKLVIYHLFKATIILSFFGTLFFIISYIFNYELFGVNISQKDIYSVAFGTYFSMREPNYYGSFMIPPFFISFSLLNEKSDLFTTRLLRRVLIFSSIGILLSFTRSVWLAIIIGILLYYAKFWRKLIKNSKKIFLSALVGVIILILLVYVFKVSFLTYKLTNLIQLDSGSGQGRLMIYFQAIDNWLNSGNLWFGNGTYSYASFFTVGDYDNQLNAWIGNWLITILNDTGIIGLAIFFIYFFFLIYYTYTNRKKSNQFLEMHSFASGLRLSLVGIFISFFFSLGTTFLYPWMLFGIISAYGRIQRIDGY